MPVNILQDQTGTNTIGMPEFNIGGYGNGGVNVLSSNSVPGQINTHFVGNVPANPPVHQPVIPPSSDSDINSVDLIGETGDLPPGYVDPNITQVTDTYASGASLSQYMQEHPGMDYEDYLKYMSAHSDEWAEKYLDYLIDKKSIDEQNAYTANREDTAYQRLVQDLKAAGLNPALLYGSSASPSASGSVGHFNASEGATYRANKTTQGFKDLVIAMVLAQWTIEHQKTNDIFNGLDLVRKYFGGLSALFG